MQSEYKVHIEIEEPNPEDGVFAVKAYGWLESKEETNLDVICFHSNDSFKDPTFCWKDEVGMVVSAPSYSSIVESALRYQLGVLRELAAGLLP